MVPSSAVQKVNTAQDHTPTKVNGEKSLSTGPKGVALERIKAMSIRGMSDGEIAKVVGCNRSNVTRRLGPYRDHIETVRDYMKDETPYIADKERILLDKVTGEDATRDRSWTTAWAIALDKRRLVEGKTNQNVGIIGAIAQLSEIKRRVEGSEMDDTENQRKSEDPTDSDNNVQDDEVVDIVA